MQSNEGRNRKALRTSVVLLVFLHISILPQLHLDIASNPLPRLSNHTSLSFLISPPVAYVGMVHLPRLPSIVNGLWVLVRVSESSTQTL